MSDIICVTNRHLCDGDFIERINKIAKCSPAGIILREKDMTEGQYENLAGDVMEICRKSGVICILHSFKDVAARLSARALHMPMELLKKMPEKEKTRFDIIGASCHSVEEARKAQRLGCTYITAGHIFSTGCKRNLEPRGIEFLKEVCVAVSVPGYAIGGIGPDKIGEIKQAGAEGACIMSGMMTCREPGKYFQSIETRRGKDYGDSEI